MKTQIKALIVLLALFGQQYSVIATEQGDAAELVGDFSAEEQEALAESADEHEFLTEVSRLMDIIINSLYQHKEVFMREMISNSSDALDKVRFMSLTDDDVLGDTPELEIRITFDDDAKTVDIRDTGIGMTREGLINNLGTIAKTGSTEFIQAISQSESLNLIGQFGVGFYSTFLAANKVTVISKNNDDLQYVWESSAANSFTIAKDPRGNTLGRGTLVRLHLKSDAYDFCDQDVLSKLIKKYSEFINFPIYLRTKKEVTREVPVEEDPVDEDVTDEEVEEDVEEEIKTDEEIEETDKTDETDETEEEEVPSTDEETDEDDDMIVEELDEDDEDDEPKMKTIRETIWEWVRVNEMKALWYRSKEDIEDEEYNAFYKSLSKDYEDPLSHIHFNAEGEVQFRSILFIPKHSPYDQFDNYHGKSTSLKLYVRRVLINDEFEDLMPRYLNFVKGIVDSDDLPLNVSREHLQQLKMIRVMSRKLVRKTIEMIRRLAEFNEEEVDADTEEDIDEEYEDDDEDDDEEYDDEDEDDDEEWEDDDYDDEFDEKTEEEQKEEREERERRKQEHFEQYSEFWLQFGKNIKLGIIEDPGNRNKLAKLTRWYTTFENNDLSSFDEYIERMKDNQEVIYFISGDSVDTLLDSPNLQGLLKKGYEVSLSPDIYS